LYWYWYFSFFILSRLALAYVCALQVTNKLVRSIEEALQEDSEMEAYSWIEDTHLKLAASVGLCNGASNKFSVSMAGLVYVLFVTYT
jgi:hypothetical protein